jgi:hypothetical protein
VGGGVASFLLPPPPPAVSRNSDFTLPPAPPIVAGTEPSLPEDIAAAGGAGGVQVLLGIGGADRHSLLLLLHAAVKKAGASAALLSTIRERLAGKEPRWEEDPTSPPAVETPEGTAARAAVAAAKAEESAASSAAAAIEAEAATDFGPDAAFFPLKGKCFDVKIQQYTYSACPFGSAKQDSTSLGTFSGWRVATGGNADYGTMLFSSGTRCWNGPDRSMKLEFSCGAADALTAVEETEKCVYTAKMATPAACGKGEGGGERAEL